MTYEVETTTSGAALELARRHGKSILGLASWLFLLECFIYVRPNVLWIPGNFADEHWAAFLNLAFLAHKQFGTEVVFTYGPWGFLVHPRNIAGIYGWVVFGRAVLAAGCCVGLANLGARWIERRILRVLWATTILIFAEPIYLLAPLVCLLLWREPPAGNTRDRVVLHVVAFSAGLAANTKFTCFILLALLVGALLFRRQSRWLSATAMMSWVFFWLMAGQSLLGIPAFISNSFEMASTYSAAQAWVSEPWGRLAGFLLCGLPAVVCMIAELRLPSLQSFALVCWIGLFEYIVLGQAIIRCDLGHISLGLIGIAFPFAMALIPCPHLWPAASRDAPLNRPFFVLATFFSVIFTYFCTGGVVWMLEPSYRTPFVEAIYRVGEALQLRSKAPAPSAPPVPVSALTENADTGAGVLPSRLNYAFANGFPLINIPTLQSVMAWSPRLTKLDADLLESAKSPASIYFEVDPVDHHYPSLEDPLAWRSLITHYQPAGNQGQFMILSRRSRPARFTREPMVSRSFHLGDEIEVPATAGNIVWAEIEAHRNWRWKLQMVFMNFQRLILDVETASGNYKFFFQDPNATCGFILSPYIDSLDTMRNVYMSAVPVDGPQRVKRFTLREAQPDMESFETTVQVRLYSVSIR